MLLLSVLQMGLQEVLHFHVCPPCVSIGHCCFFLSAGPHPGYLLAAPPCRQWLHLTHCSAAVLLQFRESRTAVEYQSDVVTSRAWLILSTVSSSPCEEVVWASSNIGHHCTVTFDNTKTTKWVMNRSGLRKLQIL